MAGANKKPQPRSLNPVDLTKQEEGAGAQDYKEKLLYKNWESNSFLSSAKWGGLLRSNRFFLQIMVENSPVRTHLNTVMTNLGISLDDVQWNVLKVAVPPVNVAVQETQVNTRKFQYMQERQDGDLSVTFLESSKLSIRKFFYEWIKYGYDEFSLNRRFYNDFAAAVIEVRPISAGGKVYSYDKFLKCFPFSVSDLNYDVSANDQNQVTEVKFKFAAHSVVATRTGDEGDRLNDVDGYNYNKEADSQDRRTTTINSET